MGEIPMDDSLIEHQNQRFRRNAWIAVLIWTLLLSASMLWNMINEDKHALEAARKVAFSYLNKDLAFQQWLRSQGQLYAPANPQAPDHSQPDSLKPLNCLATLNHFILGLKQSQGIHGRVLTLPPSRRNPPDAWEQRVLDTMLKLGAQEVFEVMDIRGEPYMRVMRPIYQAPRCATETRADGSEAQKILAAISVAVPMHTELAYKHNALKRIGLSHTLFWIAGLFVILHTLRRNRQRFLERLQSENKLRQAAKVFASTSEGVMLSDPQNKIIMVNQAFSKITGYTESEVLGQDPRILKSNKHDQAFFQAMWASIRDAGQWHGEIWNRRKNGEIYPEWLNIGVVRDQDGKLSNYVGVFSDITTIKESEERLNYLAHHDPLTGLPNRLLFNARLEHTLQQARRYQKQVAILFLDLDRFKNVNDTLGHPSGDQLLKQAAERLRAELREEDTLARLGGDEFVSVVEAERATQIAAVMARKLLAALGQPFVLLGHEVFIGGSIGISLYPSDGEDCATLVKNADIAMYRAKQQGRNNYQFYTESLTEGMFQRLTLESQLRRALERNELVLYYQPQLDVADGCIIGVEALIRWQHPEKGLLAPGQFIPLADEMGLLTHIGEWVLHTACTQAREWEARGLPTLRMAVNLSAYQITRSDVTQTVREALDRSGFDPAYLELEITEDFFMQGDAQTLKILQELKAMGITLAIDDFGTGYSSLSYLKRFPIDRIKIDQSFIRDIPLDADDEAIARAIIAIGHTLKLTVIAEGVETLDQHDFLLLENCDEMQGFLCSPPLPAEALEHLLREQIRAKPPFSGNMACMNIRRRRG